MAKREPTRLSMTGEEFKRLIEQPNPDGVIDTLPEMMRAMQGISDDGETIDDKVQQAMDSRVGTEQDVDEIFNQ